MKIWFENVDFTSDSGPNSFGQKLHKQFLNLGHECEEAHNDEVDVIDRPDVILCFIESSRPVFHTVNIPTILRLDGIYFNTKFDWQSQNKNIKRTYDNVEGIVFQSEFAKKEIFEFFGPHDNATVIQNGADIDYINTVQPAQNKILDSFENVWASSATWRPHKRLKENVDYFLEHSTDKDCLVIAGKRFPDVDYSKVLQSDRVFYVDQIPSETLFSLYKRSKYFLHLAWLDHCPNVVVDALASGCQIICSSTGGTKEIAGKDAILIEEEEWGICPVDLYSPPALDFSKKIKNNWDLSYNMEYVAEEYINFLSDTKNKMNKV